jgi:energy-coupling factor transporter ATP-binding protein EcfA2
MLKRLRLKDFKSFVDEQVTLAPLTLLVGANASGKSNFLDAIQFLHANSFDLDLEQILNGEQRATPNAWRGLRGGAPEAARLGTSRFTIESSWSARLLEFDVRDITPDRRLIEHPYHEFTLNLAHRMTCRTVPQPLLEAESLTSGEGQVPFETGAVRGDRIEVPITPLFGDVPETRLLSAHRSVLLWTHQAALSGEIVLPSLGLTTALTHIGFLNIQPAAMRGYGRRGAPLGVDGSNLSGVLAQLCDEPEAKRGLVDWLAEFCAPEITDLDFVEIKELGDVMAMFVEKGGKRISARSLSDGTLRFLGVLLALRTAEPGSVILMEEVDTGLHPTRIRLLLEYLETVTREREIQVIATTHSPVILQWLSPEALRSTLVFGRVPEHEGTLVRRLGDLPHFDEVAKHKGIDELFTTGWMEMAL